MALRLALLLLVAVAACSPPATSSPPPVQPTPPPTSEPPPPPPPSGDVPLKADGATCLLETECESGICEGEGCGADKPGVCAPKSRGCTKDLRPYCGCDGKTFRTSGSCPGKRFSARAECPTP